MIEVEHLVLGSGFFGVAVYNGLKERFPTAEILIVSQPQPGIEASTAAAGIVTESWYTANTVRNQYAFPFTRKMVSDGLKFLERTGVSFTNPPELRVNEVNGTPNRSNKDTWLLWNKTDYLTSVDAESEHIESIDFAGRTVITDRNVYMAEHLHIALGANLTNFTSDIPMKHRPGEAIFIQNPSAAGMELVTYYVKPYTHFTSRPWNNSLRRVGDTTKPGQLDYLVDRFGMPISIVKGIRPAPVGKGWVYHRLGSDQTHIYTSGGRIGLGLSGMVGVYLDKLMNDELRF